MTNTTDTLKIGRLGMAERKLYDRWVAEGRPDYPDAHPDVPWMRCGKRSLLRPDQATSGEGR